MSNMNYRTETMILPPGAHYYRDITLMVDPGQNGGRVEIQVMDSNPVKDAAWYTPADGATYTEKGAFVIPRANTPPMRIVTFNGAKYEVFGK